MEAEAVSFSIHAAQSAKFLPIIMELDSKEIVNLSCNKKGIKTAIFWTTATIQASLKSLNGAQIQHVPRGCNTTAHALAKIALDYDTPVVWLGRIPTETLMLFSDLYQ